MNVKKLPKPTKQDLAQQIKIEKQVAKENVQIDHPQGQKRFKDVLKNALKKKPQ